MCWCWGKAPCPVPSAGRADCLPRGKPPCQHDKRQLCRKQFPMAGNDAPIPVRWQGLQPYGALTLFFRWRKKSVQKKASGTATPEAARPASHCGQALRYACAWLRASWPSAISGASRPSASLGGGLRPAVAPSGLSSSSVRFAHPPGKSPLLPILTAGLFPSAAYRRSLPHSWREADLPLAG